MLEKFLNGLPAFIAAPPPVYVQPSRPSDQAILRDSAQFLHFTQSKSPSHYCYSSTRSGPLFPLWPLVLLLSLYSLFTSPTGFLVIPQTYQAASTSGTLALAPLFWVCFSRKPSGFLCSNVTLLVRPLFDTLSKILALPLVLLLWFFLLAVITS